MTPADEVQLLKELLKLSGRITKLQRRIEVLEARDA